MPHVSAVAMVTSSATSARQYDREGCGACDYCLGELEPVDDAVTLARKILSPSRAWASDSAPHT